MHNPTHILAALLAICLLPACATNSTVTAPVSAPAGAQYRYEIERRDMTIVGMEALQEALDRRLRAEGLLAGQGAGLPVEIRIREYYMRDGAARVMGGIFAGRDRIISDVRVLSSSGELVGEFVVESMNATAMGTSSGLIDRHAEEIVLRLSGG